MWCAGWPLKGQPAPAMGQEEVQEFVPGAVVPGQSGTDKAEVQAAFAQIVCRALWAERSEWEGRTPQLVKAEPILHRYLENTLKESRAVTSCRADRCWRNT